MLYAFIYRGSDSKCVKQTVYTNGLGSRELKAKSSQILGLMYQLYFIPMQFSFGDSTQKGIGP